MSRRGYAFFTSSKGEFERMKSLAQISSQYGCGIFFLIL